jgi:hypothetical protein
MASSSDVFVDCEDHSDLEGNVFEELPDLGSLHLFMGQ